MVKAKRHTWPELRFGVTTFLPLREPRQTLEEAIATIRSITNNYNIFRVWPHPNLPIIKCALCQNIGTEFWLSIAEITHPSVQLRPQKWESVSRTKMRVENMELHKQCGLILLNAEKKTPGSLLTWLRLVGRLEDGDYPL